MHPCLIVNGIWGTTEQLKPLHEHLSTDRTVCSLVFADASGRSPILSLAHEVKAACDALLAGSDASRCDIVGFSMGALATRVFIQKLDGKETVRRYISISGPHHGSLNAYALPHEGVRDMRPNSTLLRDLHADPNPFGKVEVHCIYTPFDITILPPRSSVLQQSKSVTSIPVPLHGMVIRDARVMTLVRELLT